MNESPISPAFHYLIADTLLRGLDGNPCYVGIPTPVLLKALAHAVLATAPNAVAADAIDLYQTRNARVANGST